MAWSRTYKKKRFSYNIKVCTKVDSLVQKFEKGSIWQEYSNSEVYAGGIKDIQDCGHTNHYVLRLVKQYNWKRTPTAGRYSLEARKEMDKKLQFSIMSRQDNDKEIDRFLIFSVNL